MFFAAGTFLLIGLDLYLSYRRIRDYGAIVELNPLARQLAQDYGPVAGVAFLAIYNVAVVISLCYWGLDSWLHVFFGAKLGLAAMQLKSLQLETILDKILRKSHESPHR